MRVPTVFSGTAGVLASLVLSAAAAAQPAPASGPTADDPMLTPALPAQKSVGSWQEALQILRERSTDLRVAQANINRAEAQWRTALGALLPQINATGTGTYNLITNPCNSPLCPDARTPTGTPFLSVTGTLVQPVIAPRAWWALGTANANEDTARMTLADTKRTVALGVANAMVSVVTAGRVAELNRVGLKNALDRWDFARRRQSGGASTGLDTVRAQQDVEIARASVVQGDETLRQAREALGLALGLPTQIGVASSLDARALEDGARVACHPAEGVEQRTDVVVARQQLAVAKRTLTDAKLQFSPTLNAQSTVFSTTQNLGIGSASNTSWNIQGVLQIPIWDGGSRYGALRDAGAQIDLAEQRLEATRRGATVQVTQAMRAVEVAEQARVVAANGRDLAVEVDRLVRKAFEQGAGTSLELVTAAGSLRQAEINLALKEFELLRAKIAAALAVSNCDY